MYLILWWVVGRRPGSTVKVGCEDGYVAVGPEEAVCQPDPKQWTVTLLKCYGMCGINSMYIF